MASICTKVSTASDNRHKAQDNIYEEINTKRPILCKQNLQTQQKLTRKTALEIYFYHTNPMMSY